MADKLTNSGDILVKTDQNNLIYIDPNTVLSNGYLQKREVEPENLVIYVNLEADLVPRTTLISGNETNQLVSIAKGTLNFLQNDKGKDYDTTWTDSFTNVTEKKGKDNTNYADNKEFNQSDSTAQTFGIEQINIQITGLNFIPQIQIKFIDVRGKTLFESPENSPYKAFFHIPWPIFYLTVKGYYGKAIRYRLHMVSFNSAFNSGTGNFDIDTTFVGSTFAFLNDIPLAGILNAPYMYGVERSVNSESDPTGEKGTLAQYNENTGFYDKILKKTSIGYVTLKSVYDEYKSKGLLADDFPVKTLQEIAVIAGRLDKILENEIFREIVDPKVLSGVNDFEKLIQSFYNSVDSWKKLHLSGQVEEVDGTNLYKLSDNDSNSLEFVVDGDATGTLEHILKNYTEELNGNQAFGVGRDDSLLKKNGIDIKQISLNKIWKSSPESIKKYYRQTGAKVLIDYDKLISDINNVRRDYTEQRNELEKNLQEEMNKIVKKPETGFGFEPTMRNIIGVVLANADTYIRLLKKVHIDAFNQAENRSEVLSNVSTDSIGADNIYPWPEVKETTVGTKQNILIYPGASSISKKLKSDDTTLWPEVGFVEEYNSVATRKTDPLTEKEGPSDLVTYVFETDTEKVDTYDLSTFTNLTGVSPYYDKSMTSILYEIWERASVITSIDSYSPTTIQELAEIEFENLENKIKENYTAIEILKQQATSVAQFEDLMYSYSAFERWPYHTSQTPTVSYITETLDWDFNVEKYEETSGTIDFGDKYEKFVDNLNNYKSEGYRTQIYPFNSTTYKSYLPSGNFGKNELELHGILGLRTNDAFISSPINTEEWVKDGYTDNIFEYRVNINDDYRHILNTPYFHKQLYIDFINGKISGKYASSSYLFLNSLPFKDLDDTITYKSDKGTSSTSKEVLMSTIFREIGATHFIPYHLMLKWGSIYHRYKTYITNGIDIIDNITDKFDGDLMFDNYNGRTYEFGELGIYTIDRADEDDIGLYPFYQSIFHQIIHGYTFYDPTAATTSGYTNACDAGNIINEELIMNGNRTWTSVINNSKFEPTQSGYTFLPSNGKNVYSDIFEFEESEQDNLKILWVNNNDDIITYTGETFPAHDQYFKTTGNTYSLSDNNKKVIDLIATFKPDILDIFEQEFLYFASEILSDETQYTPYDVKYSSFQTMLKDLVYITPTNDDPTISDLADDQEQTLLDVTEEVLSNKNLLKFTLANPKEIDPYSLFGFTGIDSENFDVGQFYSAQITQENLDYITLYLGEDMDLYYLNFFTTNNIALNEDNIKNLRFLIYTYAGASAAGIDVTNKDTFINYLIDNVLDKNTTATATEPNYGGILQRRSLFLDTLINRFSKLETLDIDETLTISRGYNDDIIKLELYDFFKSFNDKWVAGNSLGQRTLMEEFLFLDKANRDIGDDVYLTMDRLIGVLKQKDALKVNLFSLINLLIKNSGVDIRPLPAYVNFYGTNFSNTRKTIPSKNVARNLFGTFLEVDHEESSPKIILQYTGPLSKRLEMSDIDRDSKFANDSFDMGLVNNNPLVIAPDVFRNIDYSKSNKVVAFEVSFGDQNQSIFKGLELNQNTIRNTSESFQVLENLGNSQGGSSTAQIDIGLFDIYRTASYQCTVSCMGNVMIQPTMYFYLKNVPMFRGSYWITEVNHVIRNNGIETTFTGSRIPLQSLPDPRDSFLASYRAFFDVLSNRAVARVKQEQLEFKIVTQYETEYTDSKDNTYTINPMEDELGTLQGEKLINRPGIKEYGIPYNGFKGEKFILLIKDKDGVEWLRTTVTEMGAPGADAAHPLNDSSTMSIISRYGDNDGNQTQVTWGEIKNTTNTHSFYSSRFDQEHLLRQMTGGGGLYPNDVLSEFPQTIFKNPKNEDQITVDTNFDHDTKIYSGPVHIGPQSILGVSMSRKLMTSLRLENDDTVYFRLK